MYFITFLVFIAAIILSFIGLFIYILVNKHHIKRRLQGKAKAKNFLPPCLIFYFLICPLFLISCYTGSLGAQDYMLDRIPIAIKLDKIYSINQNIFSKTWTNNIALFDYKTYELRYASTYTHFKVMNGSRFKLFLETLETTKFYEYQENCYYTKIEDTYYLLGIVNNNEIIITNGMIFSKTSDSDTFPWIPNTQGEFREKKFFVDFPYAEETTLSWEFISQYYKDLDNSTYVTVNDSTQEIEILMPISENIYRLKLVGTTFTATLI